MRKQIEELLKSDVTGYRIAKKTGLGESLVSNLRNGKRSLNDLSLKSAELLFEFKQNWDMYQKAEQIEVEGEIVHLKRMFINYSIISKHNENYWIGFEEINKVEVNDCSIYEIEFKYADEINIFKDLDVVEQDIIENEQVEEKIYFAEYDHALSYLKIKYDVNELVELVEGV